MGLFDNFFGTSTNKSAALAKERLQIIVAHERGGRRGSGPDYLPALKKELLEVVRKYVPVDQSQIKVHLDREGGYEILELNITLPDEEPRSGRS
ncbi:MAG: cell division topological specificity factor MinE [Candidatus Competibacteraceae bacterium]|uniref:Cell division topological specificity factor n=1 Tax=Candidatus Contendobacter odensis Run_B_J11 TaxID=1400861 RepID=A0A7U7GDI6_9GAMM|nr:cell division topological specificity factor MinE [Candidatus Contendobacter odensis]MBK8533851.1 cell division topological specificity factor MinE [Candidatus Competibacteraceae bacterium]MBK8751294.1 cell division topological specificity factor MinE [Candidatus Competibacteraceae bacterium]CDH46237.1 cell division topological specificity factor, reverses MinC inhibition of FtsZ ring formation [Candidatus Contendobacter odensis Run_B_J11]